MDGSNYRTLMTLDGGYTGDYSAHQVVHLWYHVTIDTGTSASDGTATITATMRNTWNDPYKSGGQFAGFYYSRLGGGLTDDNGPYFGLYNEGNFNNYPADNRQALAVKNSSEWPSIIQFSHNSTGSVMAGNAFNRAMTADVPCPSFWTGIKNHITATSFLYPLHLRSTHNLRPPARHPSLTLAL